MTEPAVRARPPRFIVADDSCPVSAAGAAINDLYLTDESTLVRTLAERARLPSERQRAVRERAVGWVEAVRAAPGPDPGLDALLREYHLGSSEGVILMCLAEALLRIPDAPTADRLIADRIGAGDWERHLGDSDSLLVNASTWGLMLTGRMIETPELPPGAARGWLARLAGRIGEPLARAALRQAMQVLGAQFVMGTTIEAALQRAHAGRDGARCHSYDMLGEAALTSADAQRYFERYCEAIRAVGRAQAAPAGSGISVKLSALHPRFEPAQRARVLAELAPRLLSLVGLAREAGIGLTVDAEESDRLELSLLLADAVLRSDLLDGYDGFGLAVQAYQRRAGAVLQWLGLRARTLRRQLTVRLVKGAYWDSEIKRAQERGLASYPVFTRKAGTDVSYLACVRQLAGLQDVIYPQFASHNAHTIAYVAEIFGSNADAFEFQRLHGMGAALYAQVLAAWPGGAAPVCRVYAPVGAHEDLLPYLVRRLLENGANASFVHRIADARLPPDAVAVDPVAQIDGLRDPAHPRVPDPPRLYGERVNSRGVNLADGTQLEQLKRDCEAAANLPWRARPLVDGEAGGGEERAVRSPADESICVGTVRWARAEEIARAVGSAAAAQPDWDALGAAARSALLLRAADRFERHGAGLAARCVLEAGRTVPNALAEVREAVDFLRYYALQARDTMASEQLLPGPSGERNALRLRGRGVFACISPWNFPLSIFTGQIAAALAAGNTVLAKPAEQTPLCAAFAVEQLLDAGVPAQVLHFLPGDGAVGAALTREARVAGVAFTGSVATAHGIARALAARSGAVAPLIAETGGINAMIADSSALPEQVALDTLSSGFDSAGQRCSALRLLLLQEQIAPRVLQLLAGCMDELAIGDPALLATDIGPVIDRDALATLQAHAARLRALGGWLHQPRLPPETGRGHFFAPLVAELPEPGALTQEVFGPIIHVVRYRAAELDTIVDAVNALGYGLTLGIHTRIESVARRIAARARVGNVYVNRSMIGAVVGVQPFGGMGLSGTGPKAGGPHYLQRFCVEQTLSINTTASGGSVELLSLAVDQDPGAAPNRD